MDYRTKDRKGVFPGAIKTLISFKSQEKIPEKLKNSLQLFNLFPLLLSLQVWFQVGCVLPSSHPSRVVFIKLTLNFLLSPLEPSSQVAQNREMLGPLDDHGRVRTLWSNGASLFAAARYNPQVSEGKRMRRSVAARYGDEK